MEYEVGFERDISIFSDTCERKRDKVMTFEVLCIHSPLSLIGRVP